MTQGTMELIQTVTVTNATAATVDFTNIPQTYDDLVLKLSIRGNRASVDTEAYIQFNGNASNYSYRVLFGTGSSAGSANAASYAPVLLNAANSTASTFASAEVYIPNYRGSTNKSLSSDSVSETNATGAYQYLVAGLWSNTAAITSITITPSTNSFVQHSTATLYGITRVPAGAKATGGVIYDDSSYWYHVFTSSGTFTPSQNLTCDVLVVAGGGGGGGTSIAGGGGGAGGLLDFSAQSLTAQNYSVTVGAGGATSTNGSDSQFGSLTLVKGGGRGATNTTLAGSQGSGGGGAYATNATGGIATSGQGSNGGNGTTTANYGAAGGGGGKSAVGAAGTNSVAGAGGDGSSSFSSWGLATNTGQNSSGTVYYSGGGGGGMYDWDTATRDGGAGGLGGGGKGGRNRTNGSVAAIAGIANTGGGGGGVGADTAGVGAAGGSGIVIVRYAK